MTDSVSAPEKASEGSGGRSVLPGSAAGWWALGSAVVGLLAWVVLPMITMTFRETYPVTDTWVMPAIGMVLVDTAAVLSALCLWRWKERSVLNIAAAVLTIPAAVFATLMVVGEGLAGS